MSDAVEARYSNGQETLHSAVGERLSWRLRQNRVIGNDLRPIQDHCDLRHSERFQEPIRSGAPFRLLANELLKYIRRSDLQHFNSRHSRTERHAVLLAAFENASAVFDD